MQWMTPVGRGFDSSFGFLGGSEDHFEHTTGGNLFGCPSGAVDLFRSNSSGAEWCVGNVGEPHCNGTHGAYLFNAETQSIISAHDVATPLFLYTRGHSRGGPHSRRSNAKLLPSRLMISHHLILFIFFSRCSNWTLAEHKYSTRP